MKSIEYLKYIFNPAAYITYWPLFVVALGILLTLAVAAYSIGMKKFYW